jgi:hypothetical protein
MDENEASLFCACGNEVDYPDADAGTCSECITSEEV